MSSTYQSKTAAKRAIIIFWSGYGFLIAIIFLAAMFLVDVAARYITAGDEHYTTSKIPGAAGLFISAGITALFSSYFKKKRLQKKGTYVFDRATIAHAKHSFMFIPFRAWIYVFLAWGLGLIVFDIIR